MNANDALEFIERTLSVDAILYFEAHVDTPLDSAAVIKGLLRLDCAAETTFRDGCFRITRRSPALRRR
jgi:hypothetical protein